MTTDTKSKEPRRTNISWPVLTACPFSDPGYYLDTDEPCPKCGALGDDDSAETKCIDNKH